jgi:hypothetical protein
VCASRGQRPHCIVLVPVVAELCSYCFTQVAAPRVGLGESVTLECIVIATGAVVGPARAGDCRFIDLSCGALQVHED